MPTQIFFIENDKQSVTVDDDIETVEEAWKSAEQGPFKVTVHGGNPGLINAGTIAYCRKVADRTDARTRLDSAGPPRPVEFR